MYIISKIDYRIYKRYDKLAYGVTIILLLAVLIPGVGHSSGGATRWIYLAPLHTTFQPSEIAKIALVIFFASYLTDNRDKLEDKKVGFWEPLIKYLAPVILILFVVQSHLSASILIILVIATMMMMAGSKIRYFLLYGGAAGVRRITVGCIFLLNILVLVSLGLQGLRLFWTLGRILLTPDIKLCKDFMLLGPGRTFWGSVLVIVLKSIYICLSHKMILFLLLLLKN